MDKKDLNYSFTPIPTTFIYWMDNHCFKAMAYLIQEESLNQSKGKLFNGYFQEPLDNFLKAVGYKNEEDGRYILEALYRSKLISIIAVNGKSQTMRIKLNWYHIKEMAKKSIYDILSIEKVIKHSRRDKDYEITYCQHKEAQDDYTVSYTNGDTKTDTVSTQCTPLLYNTEETKKIEKENTIKETGSFFSTDKLDKAQAPQPVGGGMETDSSIQSVSATSKEELISTVKRNLYLIALRELQGETITEEDEEYQDTINRLTLFYNTKPKEYIIKAYFHYLQTYRDGVRKEMATVEEDENDKPF